MQFYEKAIVKYIKASYTKEYIMYEKTNKELLLIPKYESYMEYMLEIVLLRLPRTEKFSIGTEFKSVMYDTFRDIIFIEKIMKKDRLYFLNRIDAGLNVQRALLRLMKNARISGKSSEPCAVGKE